jgi:carbon-monoxide dehydrogenase medium subunit
MPLVSALEGDEVLTEVRLPTQPAGAGSAVLEIARRHGDFAVAGVVASLTIQADRMEAVRLVSFATGPTPIRLEDAEGELEGAPVDDRVLAAAGRAGSAQVSPTDDLHATAAYRQRVTAVLVERAVRSAIDDAGLHSKEDE